MDMRTRMSGKGRIAVGTYKMFLVPEGEEVPPLPADEVPYADEYKAAIGVNLWGPEFGLGRLESTSFYVRAAIRRVWREYENSEAGAQGQIPVIRFTGSHQVNPKRYPNKTYYAPEILVVGWLDRAKIASFAAQEPTVPLPTLTQNDSQLAAVMRAKLEAPPRPRREDLLPKPGKGQPKSSGGGSSKSLKDDLDDSLPEDL
jgi:hypothetical protein